MYWDTEYLILNNFIQPFQKINIKGHRTAKDVNKQTKDTQFKLHFVYIQFQLKSKTTFT